MKKRAWTTTKPGTAGTDNEDFVDLRLYVADKTPRCLTAYENIRKICEEYVPGGTG